MKLSRTACGLRRFVVPAVGAALLAVAGCQSGPAANVELKSLDSSRDMSQQFTKAYFSRAEAGDYDIVLLEQAMPSVEKGQGDFIPSADAVPLTHVLHVKILWRPKKAIRADSPTATNAAVNWTVLAGDGAGRADYEGVGFARVYGGDDQISVSLRNITLKPRATNGTLGDPIGASRLEADFKAQRDPAAVRSTLEFARPSVAAAPSARAQPSPPARPPGP